MMRRTCSRLLLGFTLLAPLGIWPAARGGAQNAAATLPPAIRTLDKALTTVVWNENTRGPVLIIAPEQTRIAGKTTLTAAPPGRGYTLSAIAPAFQRKLVSLPTLTVLAPTEMVVINTQPEAPDLLDGLPRDVKMRQLMARLSPAQWKLLGGARGLGAADLDNEERALFLSLLPDPFRVERWTVGKDGMMTKRLAQTELVAGARAGVRVRVRRSLSLMTLMRDHPRGMSGMQPHFGPPGGETLRLDDEPEFDRSDTFGVILRKGVPNRLKPGDLSLDVLSASVPLAGAATVNDLITRAGKATGLELWADRRVGDLPVHVRGTSAQAGDVLKALCLAVTGTFRRVEGSAFVLTDDLLGMGARKLRLAEWYAGVSAEMERRDDEFRARIAAHKPFDHLDFASDDPLAPSPAMREKIAARTGRGDGYEESQMPAASLTPALRAHLAQEAARRNAEGHDPIRTDAVAVETHLGFDYVVPGAGTAAGAHGSDLGPESGYKPQPPVAALDMGALLRDNPRLSKGPVPLPATVATRALLVAPGSAEAAKTLVRAAKRRGFTHVWVEGEAEVLKAALDGATLPVVAVVRPLRARAGDEASWIDRNLLGEITTSVSARHEADPAFLRAVHRDSLNGGGLPQRKLGAYLPRTDWLPPVGKAGLLARARTLEIAALPGLAGLVLRGLQPPGYAGARDTGLLGWGNASLTEPEQMGYTPAMRLAFLRRARVDPLDLIPPDLEVGAADLRVPFFLDDNARGDTSVYNETNSPMPGFNEVGGVQWDKFRQETNERFLADLHGALRVRRPGLPLFAEALRAGHRGSMDDSEYGSWIKGDAPPRRGDARSLTGRVLFSLPLADPTTADDEAWNRFRSITIFLAASGLAGQRPDGFVLDLSALSATKAAAFLETLAPAIDPGELRDRP